MSEFWLNILIAFVLWVLSIFNEDIRSRVKTWWRSLALSRKQKAVERLQRKRAQLSGLAESPSAAVGYFASGMCQVIINTGMAAFLLYSGAHADDGKLGPAAALVVRVLTPACIAFAWFVLLRMSSMGLALIDADRHIKALDKTIEFTEAGGLR